MTHHPRSGWSGVAKLLAVVQPGIVSALMLERSESLTRRAVMWTDVSALVGIVLIALSCTAAAAWASWHLLGYRLPVYRMMPGVLYAMALCMGIVGAITAASSASITLPVAYTVIAGALVWVARLTAVEAAQGQRDALADG